MMGQRPSPEPNLVQPDILTADPWAQLARLTPARLALGRVGAALPTSAVLSLAMAQAEARDAVHAVLDTVRLAEAFKALEQDHVEVESAAPTREAYLRRPDFGRRLSARSRDVLGQLPPASPDLTIVVADGLSATAVHESAAAVLGGLLPALRGRGYALSPLLLARQARVALGDEIGQMLKSRVVVVLIGERPGMSAADSLGAYLTFGPRVGRSDAERNCVSNIRPGGLAPARAAQKIAWLLERAFALSFTGIGLKDDSEGSLLLSSPTKCSEA